MSYYNNNQIYIHIFIGKKSRIHESVMLYRRIAKQSSSSSNNINRHMNKSVKVWLNYLGLAVRSTDKSKKHERNAISKTFPDRLITI